MRSWLARLAFVGVVLATAVTLWLVQGATRAQESSTEAQVPARENQLISDYSPPPPDLRGMVDEAQAVALVRIERHHPAEKTITATNSKRLVTIFTTTVVEVFKGINDLPAPREELQIVREGGVAMRGSYVEKLSESGFPPFRVGEEYVLFLTKDPATGLFTPKWAADGTYAITAARVQSAGRSAAALSHAAKTGGGFLKELRKLRQP